MAFVVSLSMAAYAPNILTAFAEDGQSVQVVESQTQNLVGASADSQSSQEGTGYKATDPSTAPSANEAENSTGTGASSHSAPSPSKASSGNALESQESVNASQKSIDKVAETAANNVAASDDAATVQSASDVSAMTVKLDADEDSDSLVINSAQDFDDAIAKVSEGNTLTYTLGADIQVSPTGFLTAGSMTLLGNGHTLTLGEGNGAQAINAIGNSHLTLGKADGSDTLTIISTDDTNPIVLVAGTATCDMYDGVTLGPSASSGTSAGVQINESGTFNMHGGLITGCKNMYSWFPVPSAVLIDADNGSFNMSGGTISNCEALAYSSILVMSGSMNMTGGSITNNTGIYGGAIYTCTSGSMNLTGGSITNNTAKYGGGVFFDGDATVNGTEIYNNTATSMGDDLYINNGKTVQLAAAPAEKLSPCGHKIDGWYYDMQYGDFSRWSCGGNNTPQEPGTVSGVALKAAHGAAIETIDIAGSNTWVDSDNQDGIRPSSVTVHLLANGNPVDSKTVTADDNWGWSFTDLPKLGSDGQPIAYTLTADSTDGYTTTIDGYNVTNEHVPATIDIAGSATWVDSDNKDGKRPSSITIRLLADGNEVATKAVAADDNWSWNFSGLSKFANGKEITYTISEDEIADYTIKIDGYNVTNSHEAAVVPVTPGKDTPGKDTPAVNNGGNGNGGSQASQTNSQASNQNPGSSSSVNSGSTIPRTGDDTNIFLLATMLAFTLAGIALLVSGFSRSRKAAPGKHLRR